MTPTANTLVIAAITEAVTRALENALGPFDERTREDARRNAAEGAMIALRPERGECDDA